MKVQLFQIRVNFFNKEDFLFTKLFMVKDTQHTIAGIKQTFNKNPLSNKAIFWGEEYRIIIEKEKGA